MHAFAAKEVDFVRKEIADQVQAVHMVVFPQSTVCDLPNLWLLQFTVTPQEGRYPT